MVKTNKKCHDCGKLTDNYYPLYSKDKDKKDEIRCSKCHENFVRYSTSTSTSISPSTSASTSRSTSTSTFVTGCYPKYGCGHTLVFIPSCDHTSSSYSLDA